MCKNSRNEILKLQAIRFGIHILMKLPHIMKNGITYEICYDLFKKPGILNIKREIDNTIKFL